ncbi:MAG: hypothetical protein JXA37_14510 [Chloroflexia bacterium]|nr:hypothetical protein [Chloroflexia bacterium]
MKEPGCLPACYRYLSRPAVLAVAGVLTVGLMLVFQWLDRAGRPVGTPDITALQLAFNREEFVAILQQWGAEGRRFFRISLFVDYVFAPVYAVFFGGLFAWLSGPAADEEPHWLQLALFSCPFGAALCDYVENSLHLWLIRDLDQVAAGGVLVASIAASIKDLLLLAVILGCLAALASRVIRRLTGRA